MSDRNNAAVRLARLFEKGADPTYKDWPAYRVWADILNIPDEDRQAAGDELLRRMAVLLRQLNVILDELRKKGHREEEFKDTIDRLKWAINPLHFNAAWEAGHSERLAHGKEKLDEWADLLDGDEGILEPRELAEKETEVRQWASVVRQSKLSDAVRTFILGQLRLISRAFRDYPIAGAEAFSEAAFRCRVHAVRYEDLWDDMKKDAAARRELERLAQYWQLLVQWSGRANAGHRRLMEDASLVQAVSL